MNKLPSLPVAMSVFSQPVFLPVVRAMMEKMCELSGLDSVAAGAVVLSVDEALTNIIKHAYHGSPDQRIDIEVSLVGQPQEQSLRISLRDYGQFVDPSVIKSRDLADVRPGGLGVHIISNCMDAMDYSPAQGGGTLLTLTKNIPNSNRGQTK